MAKYRFTKTIRPSVGDSIDMSQLLQLPAEKKITDSAPHEDTCVSLSGHSTPKSVGNDLAIVDLTEMLERPIPQWVVKHKMCRCPICGCSVRNDRLEKHKRKTHHVNSVAPIRHSVRPVSIWSAREPSLPRVKKQYTPASYVGSKTTSLSPEEINYKDRGQRGISLTTVIQKRRPIEVVSMVGWNQATINALSL